MKPSYWDKPSVSERRREIRLEGRPLEGVECAVLSAHEQDGWDQPARVSAQLSNLSAGGVEVNVAAGFPFTVDTSVKLELRFCNDADWLVVPAIVRHLHYVESGCLVGLQFLWSEAHEADVEYQFCENLLRLERRRV